MKNIELGENDIGIIVSCSTGVVYSTQVGGMACYGTSQEPSERA